MVFFMMSSVRYQIKMEPAKLPKIQSRRDQSKVRAAPRVMTFAMQCWKPQKMKSGMPKRIPRGVPFLYIFTARYIITPQRTDLMKKAREKSQVATLSVAVAISDSSARLKMRPMR